MGDCITIKTFNSRTKREHCETEGVLTNSLIIFGIVCPPKASAQTKISEFNVAIAINKNVIWLDITVNKTHLVHALNCTNQFPNVESVENHLIKNQV